MELTYSAMTPDETSLFEMHVFESIQDVSPDTAMAATGPSAAGELNLEDRASVSTSGVNYRKASDDELLKAARSGDGRAFTELSGRSVASLRQRLFRILRNREDAEDALQDALLKAYSHLGQFRGTCKFSSWLTSIATNSALMQLRKRKSHREVPLFQNGDDDQAPEICEYPDPSPNAEQLYARRQAVDLLECAAQQLSLRYRTIVNQYHEQEHSLQESADALGITVTAAKSRLLRARLAMRTVLERKSVSMEDAWI